jgi:hypothetical protein
MSGGPAKAIFYEAQLSFDVGLIELGRLALADHWSTYPDSHPCSIDDGFCSSALCFNFAHHCPDG